MIYYAVRLKPDRRTRAKATNSGYYVKWYGFHCQCATIHDCTKWTMRRIAWRKANINCEVVTLKRTMAGRWKIIGVDDGRAES